MPRATFPRAARLLRPQDFARLRDNSRRVGSRNFSAQVGASAADGARLGLAISKRVSKRAVRRNRIKRLARDSFRHARADLPAFDILLIARSGADLEDNASLRGELVVLWKRIAALNDAGELGTMRA